MKLRLIGLAVFIAIFIISVNGFASDSPESKQGKDSEVLYFEIDTPEAADDVITEHLRDIFPIISESDIRRVISGKEVKAFPSNTADTSGGNIVSEIYKVSFEVPKNFLADTAKILWELNIPEFKSRIYQLFEGRKIYIDTWPNVVGTINDKTYTGNFQAYKIRNWPFYKDPDPKKSHLAPTKPGPGNPLGLFVVHYDENSLRYFHGSNKNHLLYTERRSLSHGCVRNDNDNIEKMKQFIIKRVVKSEDLSSWLGSKKTVIYEFQEIDKFPVRIIYKTYDIDFDENGYYITMFDDIYKYADRSRIDPVRDVDSLVIVGDYENVKAEFNSKVKQHGIPDDALNMIIDYVLNNATRYEKLYINDLKQKFML
ncbi:MAG: L,D-transpeptidase [Ignavibacteria bacterium]|nr:L,D-transpeptidase [Ignavibacteria bacterium]